MFQHFSYDDFRKTRRSLLIFSVATLLFAGVTIVDGNLDILGLKIQISHQRIVSTGQIATLVLLVIYLLQMAPEMINLLKSFLISRQNKLEKIETYALQDSYGLNDGDQYEYGPTGEFKELEDKFAARRFSIGQSLDPIVNAAKFLALGAVDFILPAAIGMLCAYDPHLLDRYLSATSGYQLKNQIISESLFDNSIVSFETLKARK